MIYAARSLVKEISSCAFDWLEFNNSTIDAMNGGDDLERETQAAAPSMNFRKEAEMLQTVKMEFHLQI